MVYPLVILSIFVWPMTDLSKFLRKRAHAGLPLAGHPLLSSILNFSRLRLTLLNKITAHAFTLALTDPFIVNSSGFSIRSCDSQGVSGEGRFKGGLVA